MRNIKLLNSIYIKLKNMLNSIAIQLCLFLILLASCALAFFPWIHTSFFSSNSIKIEAKDISIDTKQFGNIKLVNKNADVAISFKANESMYNVTFYTSNGRNAKQTIDSIIYTLNVNNLKSNTNISFKERQMLQNRNITYTDKTDTKMLTENQTTFIMMIVLMFFIMTTILISRIGAQVAYEKGTQLTEVILTSLTKTQLFEADVISSFIVVIINVIVILLPMIIASIINDNKIVSDFSFLSGGNIFWILLHLTLCIYSLIVLCIGLCSISKRAEDSNAYSTIMLAPVMVSYLYTLINSRMYHGIWNFLNYIPLFSAFPILSEIITNSISTQTMIVCVISDIVFICIELLISKRIYTKNISKL
ncbi:ABC transporter permease [Clostridium hydrogenum]|uniref:ABC transporter permease n=1 Tax=Clostridium hydrogenum TaxID=2855764 RepID=UPI001F458AD7|nr:ABC transporter permease [Clostridium hydrogenum]